jgi:molybdate transport system regulatory protein
MIVPRYNVWLEKDGEVVISMWRVRLLEAIERTGSITAAAKELDVPYRRAWEKVQEMEDAFGTRLLETETGGVGGGGASLTTTGVALITHFRSFSNGIEDEIKERFKRVFKEWLREASFKE